MTPLQGYYGSPCKYDLLLILTQAMKELMEKFRKTRYTRFPVYQDSKDNVVGIINIKDLLLEEEGEVFFY